MSLTLARLCGEWQQIIQDMNNLLAEQIIQDMNNLLEESRWRNQKAAEEIGKPLKKLESHWRKQNAVEEIRKPLKKIFLDFSEIEKPLNRWRKSNFEQGKFRVSFWHQIFYYLRAWIYLIGFSVFQLLITLAFQTK